MKCPHCGQGLVKNGLNPSGSQKYLCRNCRRVTTPVPTPVGVDPDLKRRALQLVLDGTGFRAAARQVGVAHSAVLTWFKALAEAAPARPAKPTPPPEQIELDELFTFVQTKKNEIFVMTAVERETRCILGWQVVVQRTEAVAHQLIDEAPNAFQDCTDGFSLYEGRNYHRGYHLVAPGKSQTYAVEADNAELRHYIKCLARSTRCFAKQLDSLIRRVKLFVHCWNQRQLHRRTFPKYVRPLFSFASFHF